MSQNFTTIWRRLELRAPSIGPALAQDLVRDAFNQLAERREWSWLMKSGSFFPSVFYNTGTVSLIPNSNYVIASGSSFDPSFIGCQFRVGSNPSQYSTYTITAVPGPTTLVLDNPWSGPIVTDAQFQIFQCYLTVPEDFQYFYSVINPSSNYRLHHNVTQMDLDSSDAQRTNSGIVYAVAFYDYTQTYTGVVGDVLRVNGAGPVPISTTSYGYSYPSESTYVLTITVGGVPGGALEFAFRQDYGSSTTLAVTDNSPIDLTNGVQIYFPQDTYILGDVFIINCTPTPQSGVPRYELWPRPINAPFQYPYQYVKKLPELSDSNPTLPDFIARRGDVLLEMALANCARTPGTATMANPYYNLAAAQMHDGRAEKMIYELEKKDDDTAMKDLTWTNYNYCSVPWMDGSWLQRHAIYPY